MSEAKGRVLAGEASVVLAGQAGQGLQAIEYIFSRLLRDEGWWVFSTGDFMSRIRGGANATQIRVSSRRVGARVDRVDILVALDRGALAHFSPMVGPHTLVLGEAERLGDAFPVVDLPLSRIAGELGSPLVANSAAVGALAGIFGIAVERVEEGLRRHFSGRHAELADKNAEAARRGLALGAALVTAGRVSVDIPRDASASRLWLMTGSEAVGLGALAGGCDFISSYPMSPGTGVLQFLAAHKNEFGLVVDQAEDEIAAANMAQGAWYAGARALVTTSGGGFALMTETVSLAGMIETPLVVHLGQRPGPATGLPTRTEQGDLELVLHAGHGDFPRAIFAPGDIAGAFELTRKAFEVADAFQVPAFVLTDQFLLDSSLATAPFAMPATPPKKELVETEPGYQRYASGSSPLSPRGVPGFGRGIVRVDSDEHDAEGLITEDAGVRVLMMDRRLAKEGLLAAAALPPLLEGPADAALLLLCWGSTLGAVSEAMAASGLPSVAMLHVSQVWPLHSRVGEVLAAAPRVVAIENNATGQFARLVASSTGARIHETILRYDGRPFSVEGLASAIRAAAGVEAREAS